MTPGIFIVSIVIALSAGIGIGYAKFKFKILDMIDDLQDESDKIYKTTGYKHLFPQVLRNEEIIRRLKKLL